jgi:DNA-directed RNA polymerase subunit RPC12/RpoP
MKVRFACEQCGQRLSVDESKAGKKGKCPKCEGPIVVPTRAAAEEQLPQADAEVADDDSEENVFSAFTVYDDEAEIIYESDYETETGEGAFDPNRLAVSRSVIYAQGVLLGVVALVAFSLGVFVGGVGKKVAGDEQEITDHSIAGVVTYVTRADETKPDNDSVVILLPEGKLPDQKIAIAGVRPAEPGADPPESPNPSENGIVALGGVVRRVNLKGDFSAELPDSRNYHVLIVSQHTYRPDGKSPEHSHVALLGDYFESASDLIGPNKYHFQTVKIKGKKTFDFDFGTSRQ